MNAYTPMPDFETESVKSEEYPKKVFLQKKIPLAAGFVGVCILGLSFFVWQSLSTPLVIETSPLVEQSVDTPTYEERLEVLESMKKSMPIDDIGVTESGAESGKYSTEERSALLEQMKSSSSEPILSVEARAELLSNPEIFSNNTP